VNTRSTNIHGEDGSQQSTAIDGLAVSADTGLADACQRRAKTGALIAIVSTVLFAAALMNLIANIEPDPHDERPTPAIVYLVTGLFLVTFTAIAFAVQFRKIAAVVDGAEWQTSPHTEVTVGHGKYAKAFLHLQTTNRWYRQSCPLLASVSLKKHSSVEWAGDPVGRIVVRIPGRSWLTLYRFDPNR
jgi:hypothetical protein